MNIYMLNYRTNYNFNITLNGFLLHRSNNVVGQEGGLIELNPFISHKKEYVLNVEIYANNNEVVEYNNIEKQVFEIIEADKPLEDSDFKILTKLNFDFKPQRNLLLSKVEFIPDILYTSKEIDWSNSKDLTKIDLLLEKVLTFYNDFGKIINNGNIEAYKKLFDNAHQREIVSMYYNEKEANEMIDKLSNRIALSKGNLMPLEDYQMYVHPNGKIVELRTSDNKSPLYSEDDKKVRRFGVYLHMPKNSNKLEVY